MTPNYWVRVVTLALILLYTVGVDAMAAQVPGFTLPAIWVFALTVLNPVVLLAAHALPSVLAPNDPTPLVEPEPPPKV